MFVYTQKVKEKVFLLFYNLYHNPEGICLVRIDGKMGTVVIGFPLFF